MDGLRYRERRTFCVQATVTMVTYNLLGQVGTNRSVGPRSRSEDAACVPGGQLSLLDPGAPGGGRPLPLAPSAARQPARPWLRRGLPLLVGAAAAPGPRTQVRLSE